MSIGAHRFRVFRRLQSWIGRREGYTFWSRAELGRMALIGAVAMSPLLTTPLHVQPDVVEAANWSEVGVRQDGGLRSVKIVPFDLDLVGTGVVMGDIESDGKID
jgi:hypothetical protein